MLELSPTIGQNLDHVIQRYIELYKNHFIQLYPARSDWLACHTAVWTIQRIFSVLTSLTSCCNETSQAQPPVLVRNTEFIPDQPVVASSCSSLRTCSRDGEDSRDGKNTPGSTSWAVSASLSLSVTKVWGGARIHDMKVSGNVS